MLKRLLVIVLLSAVPHLTRAEEVPTPEPTPSPDAGSLQSNQEAYGLGPSGLDSGGSTGDASALQPAGLAPLQSTTDDSTGLTAPANALQAPATPNDTLQVILGDADGPTYEPEATEPSLWGWLWFSLLFGAIITAASLVLRRFPIPASWRRFVPRLPRSRH